jgi:hypothetical protein
MAPEAENDFPCLNLLLTTLQSRSKIVVMRSLKKKTFKWTGVDESQLIIQGIVFCTLLLWWSQLAIAGAGDFAFLHISDL